VINIREYLPPSLPTIHNMVISIFVFDAEWP